MSPRDWCLDYRFVIGCLMHVKFKRFPRFWVDDASIVPPVLLEHSLHSGFHLVLLHRLIFSCCLPLPLFFCTRSLLLHSLSFFFFVGPNMDNINFILNKWYNKVIRLDYNIYVVIKQIALCFSPMILLIIVLMNPIVSQRNSITMIFQLNAPLLMTLLLRFLSETCYCL